MQGPSLNALATLAIMAYLAVEIGKMGVFGFGDVDKESVLTSDGAIFTVTAPP